MKSNYLNNFNLGKIFIFTFVSIIFLSLIGYINVINSPKEIKLGFGALQGDANGDGKVDILDFQLLSNSFGKVPGQTGYDGRCDFNSSNSVDILDFQLLSNNFGTVAATYTPTPRTSVTTTPRITITLTPRVTITSTPRVTSGPTPTLLPPPPPGPGVWISNTDLQNRPTSGAAWNAILSEAASSWGTPDVSNQDSSHDQKVLAGAYACARANQYCDKTVQGLKAAIGTESGARWLAIGRNVLGYTIAADVMRNSGRLTGSDLTAVSNWLGSFLTRTLADNNGGGQEVLTPFQSGSNASAQEGAVYIAIARYMGNTTKLNYVWNRYRLYSCDKTNNPETVINITNGFEGGWSPATNISDACAINPKGSTKSGHNIDGVAINDIVRGGSFTWPPGPTQYLWTGFRGYIDAAVLLNRAGYPALAIKDSAPLRDIQYICYLQNNTPSGWWTLSDGDNAAHLAHSVYGYNFPSGCGIHYPVGSDMILGFTDWTNP